MTGSIFKDEKIQFNFIVENMYFDIITFNDVHNFAKPVKLW